MALGEFFGEQGIQPLCFPRVYRLLHFVEMFDDKLPLVVQIYSGYCGLNECESISTGQIFRIGRTIVQKRVFARDKRGLVLSLHQHTKIPFKIISSKSNESYLSLQQILLKHPERQLNLLVLVGESDSAEEGEHLLRPHSSLLLLQTYEEHFMEANCITNGIIHCTPTYIPLYTSVQVQMVYAMKCDGVKGTNKEIWQHLRVTWENTLSIFSRDKKFVPNRTMLIYDQSNGFNHPLLSDNNLFSKKSEKSDEYQMLKNLNKTTEPKKSSLKKRLSISLTRNPSQRENKLFNNIEDCNGQNLIDGPTLNNPLLTDEKVENYDTYSGDRPSGVKKLVGSLTRNNSRSRKSLPFENSAVRKINYKSIITIDNCNGNKMYSSIEEQINVNNPEVESTDISINTEYNEQSYDQGILKFTDEDENLTRERSHNSTDSIDYSLEDALNTKLLLEHCDDTYKNYKENISIPIQSSRLCEIDSAESEIRKLNVINPIPTNCESVYNSTDNCNNNYINKPSISSSDNDQQIPCSNMNDVTNNKTKDSLKSLTKRTVSYSDTETVYPVDRCKEDLGSKFSLFANSNRDKRRHQLRQQKRRHLKQRKNILSNQDPQGNPQYYRDSASQATNHDVPVTTQKSLKSFVEILKKKQIETSINACQNGEYKQMRIQPQQYMNMTHLAATNNATSEKTFKKENDKTECANYDAQYLAPPPKTTNNVIKTCSNGMRLKEKPSVQNGNGRTTAASLSSKTSSKVPMEHRNKTTFKTTPKS